MLKAPPAADVAALKAEEAVAMTPPTSEVIELMMSPRSWAEVEEVYAKMARTGKVEKRMAVVVVRSDSRIRGVVVKGERFVIRGLEKQINDCLCLDEKNV